MNTRDLTKEEAEVISMEEYLAKRKKMVSSLAWS